MNSSSNHIHKTQAALLASGDLPLLENLGLRWHCWSCAKCRAEIAAFAKDRHRLLEVRPNCDLPKGFDWTELEASMTANIRLGYEVDSITPPEPVEEQLESAFQPSFLANSFRATSFRAIASVAALVAICITTWLLSVPALPPTAIPAGITRAEVESGGLLVKGTSNGVEVTHQGSALLLRASTQGSANIQVGLEGSVRASSVDEDSGQITVRQVYVE